MLKREVEFTVFLVNLELVVFSNLVHVVDKEFLFSAGFSVVGTSRPILRKTGDFQRVFGCTLMGHGCGCMNVCYHHSNHWT